tara:strand:+ start:172 stop:297 length:126 start_codon:yes stop_codon:yes gene_type:complete
MYADSEGKKIRSSSSCSKSFKTTTDRREKNITKKCKRERDF